MKIENSWNQTLEKRNPNTPQKKEKERNKMKIKMLNSNNIGATVRSKSFSIANVKRENPELSKIKPKQTAQNVIFNEYLRVQKCYSIENKNRHSHSFKKNNNGQRHPDTHKSNQK